MPRRILNQAEMNSARTALTDCYICETALPNRGRGFTKLTIPEHVVPKRTLGPEPQSKPDAWPIVASVHRQCDKRHKQKTDHVIKIVLDANSDNEQDWPDLKYYYGTGMRPVLAFDRLSGMQIPMVRISPRIRDGVALWVKGILSLLYGSVCTEFGNARVMPPVPAFPDREGAASLADMEALSGDIRTLMHFANATGLWDGVIAWGQRLQFRCTWTPHGPDKFDCFWLLWHHAALGWSRNVLGRGNERPWYGVVSTKSLPSGATVIDSAI